MEVVGVLVAVGAESVEEGDLGERVPVADLEVPARHRDSEGVLDRAEDMAVFLVLRSAVLLHSAVPQFQRIDLLCRQLALPFPISRADRGRASVAEMSAIVPDHRQGPE